MTMRERPSKRPAEREQTDVEDDDLVDDTVADDATVTAVQQSLFSDLPIIDDDRDIDVRTMVTKDLVHLTDAPIACGDNLMRLNIEIDVNGKKELTTRFGKIGMRAAPHPHFVRVGEHLVSRQDVYAKGIKNYKEVFVNSVTTVIYQNGTVTPFHSDVLHVLLKRLYDDWKHTGSRSGKVQTSRMEILDTLGLPSNGRYCKQVYDALNTLQGLTVCKLYRKPNDEHSSNIPDVVQSIGGIITNYEVMKGAASTGTVGRKADVIVVDFNPGIVRAMTGEGSQREWVMRSLNLSNTLKHKVPWKRQLYRMIDSRFERIGRFNMPLMEIWVGCLGKNADSIKDPKQWKEAKRMIVAFFRELKATGYISTLSFTPEGPSDSQSRPLAIRCKCKSEIISALRSRSPRSTAAASSRSSNASQARRSLLVYLSESRISRARSSWSPAPTRFKRTQCSHTAVLTRL